MAGPHPDVVAAAVAAVGAARAEGESLVVAIDGHSGVGKSTLARALAERVDAVVVEGDDFYAGGTFAEWAAMAPAARADHCIDWRRQRDVLAELRDGRTARWHGFDWEAFDGRLLDAATVLAPSAIVILEGVYAGRPELADLVDLTMVLRVDEPVRRDRLAARDRDDGTGEDWAAWTELWHSAEAHYFAEVRPPSSFDVVLDGS